MNDELVGLIGAIPLGGIIERIAHVGSSSLRGVSGRACLDIALGVWPFPLQEKVIQKLRQAGYELDTAFENEEEQRLRHNAINVQLLVYASGSKRFNDAVILWDCLRQDENLRRSFSQRKHAVVEQFGTDPALNRGLSQAKAGLFADFIQQAHTWWVDAYQFRPLELVIDALQGLEAMWFVSSGWALDLFTGQVSRVHYDVDIAVPRADQRILQGFLTDHGWQLVTPYKGRLEPWPENMILEAPRSQVHAHMGGSFIDFLLTEIQDDGINTVWRYKRDPHILRDGNRFSLTTQAGIPYLAPEIVLLYKSKNTGTIQQERGKDEADFQRIYPLLEPERRAWLYWALGATAPDHPWLDRLRTDPE